MTRKPVVAAGLGFLALLCFSSFAWCGGMEPCSKDEAMSALAEADGIRDADMLHRSFRLYSHCDDGAIGEGYSNSVALLLSEYWVAQMPRLLELVNGDAAFRKFVLHHVDELMTQAQQKEIMSNAADRCPPGGTEFCEDIRRKAASD